MKYINRIAAFFVDIIIQIIFSLGFWILFNNTLGFLLKSYYADSDSAKLNLIFLLKFFFFISFLYTLGSTFFKGNTFGKLLFNLKIEHKSQSPVKLQVLVLREFVLKWSVLIAMPLLIFFYSSYFLLAEVVFFVVFIVVNLIMLIFKKNTLIDYFMKTRVIEKTMNERNSTSHLFLSLSAAIIDFGLVYEISFLISFILRKYILFQFFYIFIFVLFLYILSSILLKGKTIGKFYLGINIDEYSSAKRFNLIFFKRELLFKYTLGIILPFFIFHALGIVNPFHIFINIIVFIGFIWYLSLSYFGKSWWAILSNTSKIFKSLKTKPFIILFLLISVLNLTVYFYVKKDNNNRHDSSIKFMGFNYPFSFTEYPNIDDVEQYRAFMHSQNTSPKEYIFKLFKKYDIVIIGETFHGESTQWEMFSDVIKDKRFAENIGHVFTEYGSVIHQNKVDTFLNKEFVNDSELEKNAACIMDFMSGGYYYFLKDCNIVNSKLPDSLKVKVHFTDIIDWNYLTRYTRYFTAHNLEKRDSLMAKVIIDWYKKTNKKCLVVTNYRHAFGYAGGVSNVKNKPNFFHLTKGNQGQYIYENFPNKTACVVQNSPSVGAKAVFFPLFEPINRGIWNKAFKLNNYKKVGFDLKGSPFGKDEFDMYPLHGGKTNLKYQDIFTGVIFNKPFMKMKKVGYPYQRFAAVQEYSMKNETVDSVFFKRFLNQFSDEAQVYKDMSWANEIVRINYLELFFYLYIVLFSYLILVYHFLRRIIKSK